MQFKVLGKTMLTSVAKGLRAGCAAAGILFLSVPSAVAQTFLSNAELLELIPGSTIYSKTDFGRPWAQVYSEPDGKIKGSIRGIYGKRRAYAKWFVRDDQWCENWGSGQVCWRVEKVDFRSLRLYNRNGSARPNLWTLEREDITG